MIDFKGKSGKIEGLSDSGSQVNEAWAANDRKTSYQNNRLQRDCWNDDRFMNGIET